MSRVRPLLLDQRDTGGAGNATRRLHEGLRAIGVDSQFAVREKKTDVPGVIGPQSVFGEKLSWLRPYVDELPLRFLGRPNEFSLNWLPDSIPKYVNSLDPDVVQLNWVAGGHLRIESLPKFDPPLVWVLHDMWPLTGGCHYSNGCDRYHNACGRCPKLLGERSWDLSRLTMGRKRRSWGDIPVTVVAPSSWLAGCARDSALFGDSRVETIPNGLDTSVFRPVDPSVGRDLFGLPEAKNLILFGAIGAFTNPRKGADLLERAIHSLEVDSDPEETALVVFGADESERSATFDLPTHYTGFLGDIQSLVLLYSAADVMVVPSRCESFGQTVTEAMACGTPVVAFDATGPSDTIVDGETGYLANAYDAEDLADGIRWVLGDESRRHELAENARERVVERYHYETVAEQYLSLYRSLV